MIRCDLLIGGYSCRVTDDVMNWDDVVMSVKRVDYDGVVRSFTSKFEFAKVARSLLKRQYRDRYLMATASVVLYTRNNSWLWNERFRCALDFSTFEDDGNVISISAVDDSLAALIKAKKGTQYEYSVDVIKDENQLNYDRIAMENTYNFSIDNDTYTSGPSGDSEKTTDLDLRFNTFNDEICDSNAIEPYYTDDDVWYGNSRGVFMKILAPVEFDASIFIECDILMVSGLSSHANLNVIGSIRNGGTNTTDNVDHTSGINKGELYHYRLDKKFINKGDTKRVGMIYKMQINAGGMATVKISNFKMKIYYHSIGAIIPIDALTPTKLLNRLLQSINGGKPGIKGEIAKGVDSRLDYCLIVAAESARGLPKAKLYSSYTKFVNWMSAEFGFVPVVGSNKVSFVHRNSLFQKKTIKTIGGNWSSFQYSVNASLIYSRVRVGYEKKDYEGVNGRDEFRFTNEYTTGVNLTDNSLELISLYRADAYGIEFLVRKRGEDTTDSDSDNDVFFVGAKLNKDRYELIREGYSVSGVISADTMFNAMYSPRSMIEANKRFIAAGISDLAFASSDGNSDVVINGIDESGDIHIADEDRLFTVGEVSIESSDVVPLDDLTGTIEIERDGELYNGYVKDAKFNYGRPEAVKYTLIVESVK